MKTKWGALMVDGRGKVGGHVAAKNRGGSYLRTKVTPSNPQTSFQQTRRAKLTSLAQGFRSLTASQIAAWNSAVESFKTTDIFGDIKSPSGINLYVRLNSNLGVVGTAAISNPPLPQAVASMVSVTGTADASDQSFEVAFDPTPVPAGHRMVIEATRQVSRGVSAFAGKYTVIQFEAAAITTPADIATAYIAKYGALVTGQKIGVRAYLVNLTSGQKSTPVSTVVTVVA